MFVLFGNPTHENHEKRNECQTKFIQLFYEIKFSKNLGARNVLGKDEVGVKIVPLWLTLIYELLAVQIEVHE